MTPQPLDTPVTGKHLNCSLTITGGPECHATLQSTWLVVTPGPPSELAYTYGAQTTAEMWKQLSHVKEPKGIHGIVNAY